MGNSYSLAQSLSYSQQKEQLSKQQQKDGTAYKDFLNLPTPVKYQDMQFESQFSLKPETFEGFKCEITRPFNPFFGISNSFIAGNTEVPTQQQAQTIKIPMGMYEFGANFATPDQKLLMFGRISQEGRLMARIRYGATENIALNLQTLFHPSEPMMDTIMCDVDVKGKDWQGQVKLGNNDFYGANYMQSITNHLSLGAEVFYLGQQMLSGLAFGGRHQTEKSVATCQISTTGMIQATYSHRIGEKVNLASDFNWNWLVSNQATASVGYDYFLRQCRIRGRIDTEGKVIGHIEERIQPGFHLLLSGEIDHFKKDYKFGFGVNIGDHP